MEIGEVVKKKRLEFKMTQEELAQTLFVSRPLISKWENGKSYPDLDQLIQLSDLFDISLDELMRGDSTMVKEKDKYVTRGIAWKNWNTLVGLILVWLLVDVGFNFFEGKPLFDIDYEWYFNKIVIILLGTVLWYNFLEKKVKKWI